MKKLLTALTVAALIATFCFAACTTPADSGNDDQNSTTEGNQTEQTTEIANGHTAVFAFTADNDVMTITETSTMYDYLCALRDGGWLTFEGSDGDYGFYITSVMGISGKTVSSTPNFYSGWDWAVYTTVTEIDGVIYSGEDTYATAGVTLYKASYGVSGLPCIEGESYALVYEYSEMSF